MRGLFLVHGQSEDRASRADWQNELYKFRQAPFPISQEVSIRVLLTLKYRKSQKKRGLRVDSE